MIFRNLNIFNKKWCLSLHQWSLLCSIIVFVITGLLTVCSALARLHTQQVWDLVQADLSEERDKGIYVYVNGIKQHSNEEKLQYSENLILMAIWILHLCTWVGSLNLSAAFVMMYGISTKNSIYIAPWILISGFTFLLLISIILVGYLDMLPGLIVDFQDVVITLVSSIIFMIIWYTITAYYSILSLAQRNAKATTTVVQSYGGYKHTVKSPVENYNKGVV